MNVNAYEKDYLRKIEKYLFFDINVWLPTTQDELFLPAVSCEDLFSELRQDGITRAVVSNAKCRQYNPIEGNKDLLAVLDSFEGLYGFMIWVLEIGFTRRELYKNLDTMMNDKIVGVRMFPNQFNHSLAAWQTENMFRYMEERRLPLMILHTQTTWETLHDICSHYPHMPVILEGNNQKLIYHNRRFISLMKKLPNLYIETHSIVQYLGIESLVNLFHLDRFIFGTYYPYCDPHAAMMMITHANIAEDVKHKIAYANFDNIIKEIKY